MADTRTCRSCGRQKQPNHYLCPSCWSSLPAPARAALNRRDPMAFRRLSDLHEQLRNHVPLNEIQVSP